MNLTENGANSLRMRMLDKNAIHIVEEAERLGLGTTLYELVSIDWGYYEIRRNSKNIN